jgi:dienelactone hydrolase
MRKGRILTWIVIAGLVGVLLLVLGGNMLGRYTGLTVPRLAPETVTDMLRPHMVVVRPAGDGPFPTALLLSGCDGPRDNMATWAEALAARGWASVMVDSHAPRGFTELQLWRLICAGQLLTGAERAGDIAAALAHVRGLDFVDNARLALVGASHGGWAILEFLSMADHGQVPLTLERWPDALAPDPLEGIAAAVLFYPYCGQLSRASRRGWDSRLPVLFLLARGDTIADETDCLKVVEREAARGLPIESHVYEGVTHGFDQQEKAPLSMLDYDAGTTADALARTGAFLDRAIDREPR